jgi:SAM-dependent methyltransferase
MQYLFGDTDIAARRLRFLADVYAESTREFLLGAVADRPRLALDLGCGPGYTTHFLADVLGCEKTAGLDNSEQFISLARTTETDDVSFYRHDITSVPFPVGPSDFLYCRFLLTHLRNPHAVVLAWATQLQPGGLLLMEEVEWIRTENKVFTTYLNLVEAMLEDKSGRLYVGQTLNSLEDTDILKRRTSRVKHLPVSTHKAATMFSMNIQSWKHQPFIQKNYPSSMIDQLEEELKALAGKSGGGSEIEWGLRQLVCERV